MSLNSEDDRVGTGCIHTGWHRGMDQATCDVDQLLEINATQQTT